MYFKRSNDMAGGWVISEIQSGWTELHPPRTSFPICVTYNQKYPVLLKQTDKETFFYRKPAFPVDARYSYNWNWLVNFAALNTERVVMKAKQILWISKTLLHTICNVTVHFTWV